MLGSLAGGTYLLERLRKDKYISKKNLELIDGGTGGFSLIHDFERFDTILIIDAVNFEGKPSEHKLIDLNDVKSKKGKVDFSTHESDLLNIIDISKELKEIPENIFVFAIQPKSTLFGCIAKTNRKNFGVKMSEVHEYKTSLEWTDKRKGIAKIEGKKELEVATPPEFGGHPGIWSPEDLFLASIEACIMTTFLFFSEKNNLNLLSYKSTAIGQLERIDGFYEFSKATVKISVKIGSENEKKIVEKIVKKVERACLISNSINTKVEIEADVQIG
jgi:hydrogenase maturation protease